MEERVYVRLAAELAKERVFLSEPMMKHTTFLTILWEMEAICWYPTPVIGGR